MVAELTPPTVGGQVVQASAVDIKGDRAYVSYNMRGETYLGAIDVIDLSNRDEPRMLSEAIFLDADIHSLSFDRNKVYAAQATRESGSPFPAAIEVISTRRGKLVLDDVARISLTSFAATSVATDRNNLYATSGNTGGLAIFDKSSLEQLGYIALHDARWVDTEGGNIVVMQGTPGQLSVFDQETFELLITIPVNGADIPESKSTVEVQWRRDVPSSVSSSST